MRKEIYKILEIGEIDDLKSRAFDLFIIVLILLNVLALILSTVSSVNLEFSNYFYYFEIFSIAIFTLEYFARIYSSVENLNYSKMISGRFRYMFRPMLVIDLLSILPFYLTFLGLDLRSLRILRVAKIFRLLKLVRYVKALDRIINAVKDRSKEIVIALALISFMVLIAATLMYYAEKEAQPNVFTSIPAAMWWAVATLTTVGYGDTYPVTAVGKILGSLIAIFGISAIAIPTAILSDAFNSINNKNTEENG
jgi:voltage-gated potassium channel